MLPRFWMSEACVLKRRLIRFTLAAIVGGTATVSAPAHADAQFWEDFLRSSNRRARPAPRPPERVYRARPSPKFAAVPRRAATAAGVATGATPDVSVVAPAAPATSVSTSVTPANRLTGEPSQSLAPVLAVVSLADQRLSLYGAGGLIERSKISSGTAANRTPTGVFGVTQKNRWHESNLYSGAEMPFMQRLTWGGIALHEGKLPGYPASHGCIRLPGAFAKRLFGMTRSGFRVVIAPGDIEPVTISHRVLPKARYWPAAVAEASRPIRTAGLGAPTLGRDSNNEPRLDPVAYATAERAAARADLKPAEDAETQAAAAQEAALKRAKAAALELRTAEKRLAQAQSWLTDLGLPETPPDNSSPPIAQPAAKLATVADSPQFDRPQFDRDVINAIAEHADASTEAEAARMADATARADAAIARAAFETADARVEWLKKRITEMGRRQEIASILISRKNGRVYVRQAMRPVFDMPVTIRDPGEAIGNHVFVATAPAPGQTDFNWLAVSLPVEDRPVRSSGKPGERRTPQAVRAETARGALDRIEISGEVVERLSELVWAGSTIIVTDNGPGHDGIPGHDFAVETKH